MTKTLTALAAAFLFIGLTGSAEQAPSLNFSPLEQVVADDIDPKATTIEHVERVITGDIELQAAAVMAEPPSPFEGPGAGTGGSAPA